MGTTTKRAYKLQEFVAHSLNVNCLRIGRKSSRVLVTGGEDHKVNLWAIGKPNALLSLSGHSSGIDSVSFDSSEVLVAAGAASGTIKLWDLEEAKIIRTLTGHRSNCVSLDFHPFGEFFASGSLDTNLKLWDIRRKGCIDTYKGHTRGVNTIRFTPDGRWIVSGGEDNSVKVWDLTAGKILHDFKGHEGRIESIDFHPHEFLVATGSADNTVKFWDLETFELMGSTVPEPTGVRCMTFSPDGKILLCGLQENLKVYSWEPIINHDSVDVGWSGLSDLTVHEGKLLGCSCNQSCVGVWVVDISRIEPYSVCAAASNDQLDKKSHSGGSALQTEENIKDSSGKISSQNSDLAKESGSVSRLSTQQNSDLTKDTKSLTSTASVPREAQINSVATVNASVPKRQPAKMQPSNIPVVNRSDVIPVFVPRNNTKMEQAVDLRKEGLAARTLTSSSQSGASDPRMLSNSRDSLEMPNSFDSDVEHLKAMELEGPNRSIFRGGKSSNTTVSVVERKEKKDEPLINGRVDHDAGIDLNARYQHEIHGFHVSNCDLNVDQPQTASQKGGRTNLSVLNSEWKDRISNYRDQSSSNISRKMRGYHLTCENESISPSEEDTMADLMELHDQFVGSMRSRLSRLQVVHSFWQRHDIKEKTDMVTLDICACLMPLLSGLLESNMDRHQDISLDILLKLVRTFGSMIYSSLSAQSSVGVDIEAEQRLERCNLCFVELEKVKLSLPLLSRRGGSIAKSAQELNLALLEVS